MSGRSPFSLARLHFAALIETPLSELPPPPARQQLRAVWGVPRHAMATVLGCGLQTVIRTEKGIVAHPRALDELRYRRLLGLFARALKEHDPELYAAAMASTPHNDKELTNA